MGKFPSVRPESVMTQTMDDDGHDYAGKDDDDRHHDHHRHRHHDDEKDDENELITKSHAAAICTTHYLHNQRGLKVNILWVFFGYSLNILWIFKSLVQQQYAQLTISTIRGGIKCTALQCLQRRKL